MNCIFAGKYLDAFQSVWKSWKITCYVLSRLHNHLFKFNKKFTCFLLALYPKIVKIWMSFVQKWPEKVKLVEFEPIFCHKSLDFNKS